MVCLAVRRAGSGESRKTIEEARRRGSQVNMQKKIPAGTITVPVPDHAEIRIGTLQSIIRHPTFQEASLKSDLIGNCRMLETIKVHVTESLTNLFRGRLKDILANIADHCILDVNDRVFPRPRAANQYVSGRWRFERLRIILHRSGNQPAFAIVADARPARPTNGNVAGFRELE